MKADGLHVFELVEGEAHAHHVCLPVFADFEGATVAVGQRFEEDLEEVASLADVSHADLGHFYDFSASLHLEVVELLEETVYDLQDAAGLQLEQLGRVGREFVVLFDEFLDDGQILNCPCRLLLA